jgi:hypothetical protein
MVEGQKAELHGVGVVESVGEIDFNFFDLTTSNIIGNNLNVESMGVGNLACGHVATTIKVVKLATIKIQVKLWKPHHRSSIFWGFFAINDNLHVDI